LTRRLKYSIRISSSFDDQMTKTFENFAEMFSESSKKSDTCLWNHVFSFWLSRIVSDCFGFFRIVSDSFGFFRISWIYQSMKT
jgi:hypothetical protein